MFTLTLYNHDKGLFLKQINNAEGTLEFTKDKQQAKQYGDKTWGCTTELSWIKFHFKHNDVVKQLELYYTEI